MKNLNLIQAAVLGFILVLVACSPAPDAEPVDVVEVDAVEQPAAPEDGEAAGSGLVVPDICELLPADEVASLAGGELASEPTASDYGEDFKGCWYDLNLPDGAYDYYIIYVEPAAFLETVLEDSAEPVSGLGDRAQLKWEEDEEQYRLAVIAGSIGLEVNGKRSDIMIELARLILERL